MADNGSVRAWIMDNVVAPVYAKHATVRGVDKVAVTKDCLDTLDAVPEVKDQYAEKANWREMRDMVNDYHTRARRDGRSAPSTPKEDDPEQFALPGLQDVFRDRVTIHVNSVELALNTWECDREELQMVVDDYGQRRDSLDEAMQFYVSLLYHVRARGVHKVKDLYQ